MIRLPKRLLLLSCALAMAGCASTGSGSAAPGVDLANAQVAVRTEKNGDTIEEYRDERLPLQAVTRLLEAHAIRFGQAYLQSQVFLRPYPRALAGLHDSGRGREVR